MTTLIRGGSSMTLSTATLARPTFCWLTVRLPPSESI